MYEKHTTSTCRITPIMRVRKTLFRTRTREVILHVHIWPTVRFRLYRLGVLDHLVRKTYHIYIHSDPNSGSGPPCTKKIPHLHALGPQFCMYEKHAWPTCKNYPNSACTQNTPGLHTQLPQFCMYAKHFFRTRTREAILNVHAWPTHVDYKRGVG